MGDVKVTRADREAAMAIFGFVCTDDAWLDHGEGGHYANRFAAAAQAIASARAAGYAACQADVVAFCKRRRGGQHTNGPDHEQYARARLANDIERGEHVGVAK